MYFLKDNKSRTSMRSILLITFCLTTNLQFGIVNAAVLHSNRKTETSTQCNDICSSDICREEASFYLNNINQDIDPCNDFYQFACGNFIKNITIPVDKSRIGMFSIISKKLQDELHNEIKTEINPNDINTFKKLKIHYQNCMNETQIEEVDTEPLFELIEKLGGWPLLLGKNWNEDAYKWEETGYKISAEGYIPRFPFILSVSSDPKNSTKKVLILLPARTLVGKPYFLNNNRSLNAYQSFMLKIAQMLGADEETARREMNEILDFEVKLFTSKTPPDQLINVSPLDARKTVNDLIKDYPSIPWLEMLNKFLNPSGIFVSATDLILAYDQKYISEFEKLIKETPKRVLANHQIWNVVYDMIDYMPQRFDEELLIFKRVTQGVQERPNRETRCMDEIMMAFSIAVSSMYVRKYFNKSIKDNAIELVENIKKQTKRNLEEIDWMDEETRKIALDKLNAMGASVGYPDELLDDDKIDEYYSKLEIKPGNYLKGINKIAKYVKDKFYGALKPNSDNEWKWADYVASVNAFYIPKENNIIIPAGILRGLFYRYGRPEYLNYGSIGDVIGHEVTHGFDSSGRKYDKNGNYVNWWKNETAAKFLQESKCIVDEYSNYVVPEIGLHVNGNLTLAENIADNGGIKLAYRAYSEWTKSKNIIEPCLPGLKYTQQQMFWISAATAYCSKAKKENLINAIYKDTHSPGAARVIIGYSNIDDFAKDFNCPQGTWMNPEKKCNVW